MGDLSTPEGIEPRHIHEARGRWWHRAPLGILGLGILMLAAFLGWLGTERTLADAGEEVTLELHAPARIRNGEFYEMRFTVEAHRAVDDLVLLVDADVWRDVTVNTFIPAPAEEETRAGSFAFSFGPLEPGDELIVKVDAQINPDHPPAANRGTIAVADGGGPALATIDYVMEVLP